MKLTTLVASALAGLLFAVNAQAILIDRGNGLIFDDVNNISWIQDADVSGLRNWDNQVSWAEGFSLAGFDDFRLASIGELASLYGQLPGAAGSNKTGDISPFEDIQGGYWSGTEVGGGFGASIFGFGSGTQGSGHQEHRPLRLGRTRWRFVGRGAGASFNLAIGCWP